MQPLLVVLCAGASRRLGETKALVQFGSQTVVEHLLAAAANCTTNAVVVTGADHSAIKSALPEDIEVLHNSNWARGRTGGLALAAKTFPGRDLLIAPVDVPLVPRRVMQALTRAWSAAQRPARGWLAPGIETSAAPRLGHPILIGRELAQALMSCPPDQPLKSLRAQADPLWWIGVDAEEILDDLDTPEDVRRLRRRFGPQS